MTQNEPAPPALHDVYFDALHAVAGHLGRVAGYALEMKEAALVDPLTGLGNRRALEQDLLVETVPKAVLKIDGNFVGVADKELGDDRGDVAIVALATIIKSSVRPWDTVYRTGGDEFLVIYHERPADYDVNVDFGKARTTSITPKYHDLEPHELLPVVTERANERLAAFLATPENEDLRDIGFGISIGGAIYNEDMAATDLFRAADRHMQDVKLQNLPELTPEDFSVAQTAHDALRSVGMRPEVYAKLVRAGVFDREEA